MDHSRHVALGIYGLGNLSQKYIDAVRSTNLVNLVNPDWEEKPEQISAMIKEIQKFDVIRNQNFTKTFPEVAEFYSNYL